MNKENLFNSLNFELKNETKINYFKIFNFNKF